MTPERHLTAYRALGVSPAAMAKARRLADFFVTKQGEVHDLRRAMISDAGVSLAMPSEHVRGR